MGLLIGIAVLLFPVTAFGTASIGFDYLRAGQVLNAFICWLLAALQAFLAYKALFFNDKAEQEQKRVKKLIREAEKRKRDASLPHDVESQLPEDQ